MKISLVGPGYVVGKLIDTLKDGFDIQPNSRFLWDTPVQQNHPTDIPDTHRPRNTGAARIKRIAKQRRRRKG